MLKKMYMSLLLINVTCAMDKVLSPLEQQFLQAAARGKDARVQKCLSKHVDVNVFNEQGETALYLAAYYNRWSTIALLLNQPTIIVDVQSKTADKKLTVIHHVCYRVTPEDEELRTKVVKGLIEKKIDLNILDGYSETPLVRSLGQRVPATLIEYMVDAGARLIWSKSTETSPLTIASRKCPEYTLALLKSFDIKLSDIQQAAASCWQERGNKLHRNVELTLIKHYFITMCTLGYVGGENKEWRTSKRIPFNRIPLPIAKRIAYFVAQKCQSI